MRFSSPANDILKILPEFPQQGIRLARPSEIQAPAKEQKQVGVKAFYVLCFDRAITDIKGVGVSTSGPPLSRKPESIP
jgi:hypothetical protein